MSDERKPRAGSMSDGDRALASRRRRSPALGVPVEVPEELTPPPMEPPTPDYDSVPPPVRAVLEAQDATQRELIGAVGKVWELRHLGDRFDRLDANIAAIAKATNRHQALLDDMLVPQLDRWRATTDEVARQLPRMTHQLESMTLTVGNMDHRLRDLEVRLETSIERLSGNDQAQSARIRACEAVDSEHDVRITALERDRDDKKAVDKALAKQERRKTQGSSGAVAFVVAVIVAVIQHYAS